MSKEIYKNRHSFAFPQLAFKQLGREEDIGVIKKISYLIIPSSLSSVQFVDIVIFPLAPWMTPGHRNNCWEMRACARIPGWVKIAGGWRHFYELAAPLLKLRVKRWVGPLWWQTSHWLSPRAIRPHPMPSAIINTRLLSKKQQKTDKTGDQHFLTGQNIKFFG